MPSDAREQKTKFSLNYPPLWLQVKIGQITNTKNKFDSVFVLCLILNDVITIIIQPKM